MQKRERKWKYSGNAFRSQNLHMPKRWAERPYAFFPCYIFYDVCAEPGSRTKPRVTYFPVHVRQIERVRETEKVGREPYHQMWREVIIIWPPRLPDDSPKSTEREEKEEDAEVDFDIALIFQSISERQTHRFGAPQKRTILGLGCPKALSRTELGRVRYNDGKKLCSKQFRPRRSGQEDKEDAQPRVKLRCYQTSSLCDQPKPAHTVFRVRKRYKKCFFLVEPFLESVNNARRIRPRLSKSASMSSFLLGKEFTAKLIPSIEVKMDVTKLKVKNDASSLVKRGGQHDTNEISSERPEKLR